MINHGLSKEHLDLLITIFKKYLSHKINAEIYLYGSRATGKFKPYSDIDLALDLQDPETNSLIAKIKDDLEESNLPYKIDFVNWNELAKEYLPQINEQKILFWSASDSKCSN